ncbi:hypothetical protein F0562_015376 [Nyssa sinensis]|uniref:Uncharacterized protein n=1 Tax=Nyssa sinensis TaxID=561372 RepID=A0A5J4ZK77_9ASTE|nr:hypothetical protein F0562_015376 [Nyssa sinensis]
MVRSRFPGILQWKRLHGFDVSGSGSWKRLHRFDASKNGSWRGIHFSKKLEIVVRLCPAKRTRVKGKREFTAFITIFRL